MAECRRCGREHVLPRKFPTTELLPAVHPGIYACLPEVWPDYVRWLRENYAEMVAEITDDQLQDLVRHGVQMMTDLVYKSLPGFLILRNVGMGAMAEQVTIAGEDFPAGFSVTLFGDDGSTSSVTWLLTRQDADALITASRDRLGDPDAEVATDCAGSKGIRDAAQAHSVILSPDCEHGAS